MLDLAAHRKDGMVAFVAAVVLLLQAVLSSWALAGAAGQPMLDAHGNPLCITALDGNSGVPGDSGQHKVPNCCVLGCSGMSQTVAAPEQVVIAVMAPVLTRTPQPSMPASPTRRSLDHDPGSPRAPPQTV